MTKPTPDNLPRPSRSRRMLRLLLRCLVIRVLRLLLRDLLGPLDLFDL